MGIGAHENLDRQSVHFYSGPDERGGDEPGFYVSMLEQDVQLGLIPIGGRIRKTDQTCVRLLSGAGEAPPELQERVASAMATDRDPLSSAVAERVNQTGAVIVAHGRAVYELAYYKRDLTPVGFILLYLDPRFVEEKRGAFVQRVPRGTQLPRDSIQEAPTVLEQDEVRPLAADRVFTIGWPSEYRKGPRWLRRLSWLGGTRYPSFLVDNLTRPQGSRVPFDFDALREAHDRALGAVTAGLGWNARGSFDKMQTSYYFCLRDLRFRRFQVVLRDRIVRGLNEALTRAGRILGFDARLSVEGLPTVADIDRAERMLAEGKLSYKDLLNRFSLY